MRKLLLLIPLLACTLACPPNQPLEQTARDTVATAKGYLDAAKSHHPECAAPADATPVSTNCQIIAKGVAAKDSVIDALNIYCASPDYSSNSSNAGPCVPNKDLQPKLQAALDDLNRTITDVKAIGGK